jgi:RHH-type proline utilization regulon transcriptional repressor/proline dehydrogenase/delta 1-pyrroline-5-carboxylate dehydrogenase
MPQNAGGNPRLWSPGVKYGVQAGSCTHLTEFFGPLLAVMRFDKLSEGVALVNQTGYGLTSGLESLDEREWDYWKENVRAGNLYINRVTTGAVVLRQPFGGSGKSCFGPGLKAGGPNYVAQFMEFEDAVAAKPVRAPQSAALARLCEALRKRAGELGSGGAAQADRIAAAAVSYERSFLEEFGREHDHFRLVGQDNIRRYRPFRYVRVRVHVDDSPFDLFARVCAAHVAGSRVTVSAPKDFAPPALKLLEEITESWAGAIEFVEETDQELAEVVRQGQTDRVRYAAPERVSQAVLKAAEESGICVAGRPVLTEGRVELLWYLQEQSVSLDYHRYGNLGTRAGEKRAAVW